MDTTATGTVKCQGCGRTLTAPRSVSAGRGPVCRAKIRKAAATAEAKPEQIAKALELIADGGIVPTSRRGVFRTAGSSGEVIYLTHSETCTCPSGLRRLTARTCYHSLAVHIILTATGKAA